MVGSRSRSGRCRFVFCLLLCASAPLREVSPVRCRSQGILGNTKGALRSLRSFAAMFPCYRAQHRRLAGIETGRPMNKSPGVATAAGSTITVPRHLHGNDVIANHTCAGNGGGFGRESWNRMLPKLPSMCDCLSVFYFFLCLRFGPRRPANVTTLVFVFANDLTLA
jgi:hypothetical protein